MGYGEESTAATHVSVTSCARSESGGCPARGRVPALGRLPHGHCHPPQAVDALSPLSRWHLGTGHVGKRGCMARCPTCVAEGPVGLEQAPCWEAR